MAKYEKEHEDVLAALEQPASSRRVQVVGRVVEGRIEIDPASIEEFSRKYPDAKMTFVAVNAPFDPERSPVALNS